MPPRERAPERKRTRNKTINIIGHVLVYEHEHVHVLHKKARLLEGFASLPQGNGALYNYGDNPHVQDQGPMVSCEAP